MKKTYGYIKIKHRKGFTLIEMLIVIVIIGILSASLIPRVLGIQARARDIQRQADMRTLSTAINLYYRDNQIFPVSSCNVPASYIANTADRLCNWQIPGSTTGNTTYSLFSGFLSELEGNYVSQIPVDPSNTLEHNYRYSFLNRNNADNIHIQNRCNSVGSSTDRVYMAELGYKPEAKRKNDIINACPDNTPREYAHDRSTNRYKHRRGMLIFDDKYAPIGNKKVPGECWEPNKDEKCL